MKREKVLSSNLKSVGYLSRLLEIEFKNRSIYQFQNVSEQIYLGLINSKSKGTYFAENIKGKYPYRQVK